jgi:hypothetical protein
MGIPSGYTSGQVVQAVPTGINSALVLIKSQTIGTTVSSVEVTGAFSATYDNYKVILSGGVASTAASISLQLGSTTTGYYSGYPRVIYSSAAASNLADNNASSFTRYASGNTNGLAANFELLAPNLASLTIINGQSLTPATSSSGGNGSGFLNDTTSYTAFTFTPASGTLTGGTIKVYGYTNS